jgi:hypothetical protein
MKCAAWKVLSLFALCVCLIQGCATADKALSAKDIGYISSVKAVRYGSPLLMKKTAGSQAAAFTGVMFGAIGGAVGGAISMDMMMKGGKELMQKCGLPDFGQLVFEDFTARIPEELPQFSNLTVEHEPVGRDFKSDCDCVLVVQMTSLVVMEDSSGSITSFSHSSRSNLTK